MKKYVKLASLIVAVCMLVSICNLLCFANSKDDIASAFFDGETAVVKNMKAVRGLQTEK